MDRYCILQKKDFPEFIAKVSENNKVVAPVAKGHGNFAFEEVKGGDQVSIKYVPTILPPKKYFMPQKEKITQYDKRTHSGDPVIEYDELVIFGVHTCDLAGIQCLNMVFTTKPKDINYIIRKHKLTIIGLECNDYCDDYASCSIMRNHLPKGGYDLFFTELTDVFLVHKNTIEGEKIIRDTDLFSDAESSHMDELEDLRKEKRKLFNDEFHVDWHELKDLFTKAFDSKVWDDLDKRCLSCGNCTNVCPTCYCFDMVDEINLDFSTGATYRVWDSCQNETFAKVAGGESFRETRGQRQRHRYMRKFYYPLKPYKRPFCTGCGRCSRTCMAKINMKETVNSIAEEFK